MCFKNLPIEFDDGGVATLRDGIPDPYAVTVSKPDAGLSNDEQREQIERLVASNGHIRETNMDPVTRVAGAIAVNIVADLEEGRYLDGIVAGSLTKTNKIGHVLGFPYPIMQRSVDGFTLGARSVNPNVDVQLLSVNSWYDPGKERQAAEALVDSGADVLVTHMNSPAVPAVARAKGVGLIGNAVSKEAIAGDHWLGSFAENWAPYLVQAVKQVQDGTWKPEAYYGTVKNGTIGMLPFPSSVPEDVVAKVEKAEAEMRAGRLTVFEGPLKSNDGKVVVPAGQAITQVPKLVTCCTWLVEGAKAG